MKKKICIIGILLVFTSAILAGCGGNKNQGTDNSQEISSEQENTNLLKDMEEINTFDSIIARNGKLFYTVKGILADGSDISYTIYQDKTRYVLEDTYGTLIDENGDVYGTDTELGIPVRYLFIGDTYENFIADYKVESLYEYNEKEKITSKEVRDGIIYLETESPKESVEMHDFSYGLASDDADFIISEYTIDSETKEIFEIKTYAVLEEQKTLYYDVILDRECKEYTPDKEITDGVFGNDSRTISVIADV